MNAQKSLQPHTLFVSDTVDGPELWCQELGCDYGSGRSISGWEVDDLVEAQVQHRAHPEKTP